MDPISEQGLADPSLHHGCSTDSTGDWTVIGKKNKNKKNQEKHDNNDTYVQRDEEVPTKMDITDTIVTNKGSPPYEDKENPFSYLHDDEDNSETMNEENNIKEQELPPPKKLKTDKSEENWNDICDEFTKMPPPRICLLSTRKEGISMPHQGWRSDL